MSSVIVVFDDDPYFAALVQELVRDIPLRVKHFPDGANALERIRRESPRIVVADIVLPRLSGIGICQGVKADPVLSREVRVAVVSGEHEQGRMLALRAGADLYFEKPLDIALFRRSLCGF